MNLASGNISRVIAGAMSGTSADGVDVALAEISGRGLEMTAKVLSHHDCPYDAELRSRIFSIRDATSSTLREVAHITRQISLTYARANR